MRLSENQAWDIWMNVLDSVGELEKPPLNSRQTAGLVWGTSRMQRRVLHLLRRAEKKEAKRLRAGRVKNVRPFIRRMLVGLVIRVGNDLEIYEPEVARLAREEMEEINLFYDFYGELDEEDYDLFPNVN